MMSLAKKLTIRIALLVLGITLVGVSAVWGMKEVQSRFQSTVNEYEHLRSVYEVAQYTLAADGYRVMHQIS